METYVYEVANANAAAIDEALHLSALSPLIDGVIVSVVSVTVVAHNALDQAQQSAVGDVVSTYADQVSINEIVNAARAFGIDLISEYQVKMIAEGIAQSPDSHSTSVVLSLATQMAYTGDLLSLDTELSLVTPVDTFLTQERINEIRNRVRAYLGLDPI